MYRGPRKKSVELFKQRNAIKQNQIKKFDKKFDKRNSIKEIR
jgi:hypothetical protein